MTETKTFTDRTGWPSGPWDWEPDRVDWVDAGTGLPCLALRSPTMGCWCGYVAVPPGHRYHGAEYDDINVRVHGGLTFAGPCMDDNNHPKHEQVCHVPAPGEPDDVWWFGFDCGHGGRDVLPRILGMDRDLPSFPGTVYRTIEYVREQCEMLARQLAEVRSPL